ncbi:hypothetical protein GQ53DRAFT_722011 [Thozetella sp. PMI_491]|nr:hypothetical protein GQ53DRAFT_722011 [Thozetella sp. PMI_491]
MARSDTTAALAVSVIVWLLCWKTSAGCLPGPVSIRIGNVAFLDDQQFTWGLHMAAGSPSQPLAFLPQWPLNETFVYGPAGFCPDSYVAKACVGFRGGTYTRESSSTSASLSLPADEPGPFPKLSWGSDTLSLNNDVNLDGFPIGIVQNDWGSQGYHPQMALGMGVNSTLVFWLNSKNLTASRAWSISSGLIFPFSNTDVPRDGSLILGGFDRGRIASGGNDRATVQLSRPSYGCPSGLVVSISDISLNLKNGTNASLFPPTLSQSLSACITPDYPALLTLPRDKYFANFESITGTTLSNRSYGLNYYTMRYSKSDRTYDGDITIILQGGFSVRIPNDRLVVPHVEIDVTTGAYVTDEQEPDLLINALQDTNANDMPTLGRHFLTAAYLLVRPESEMFTLWPSSHDQPEDLVAVDSNGITSLELCPSSSRTGPDSVAPSESPSAETHSLSPAGIFGVAAGSVIGLASIAILVVALWRRRRRCQRTTSCIRARIGDPQPIFEIDDHRRSSYLG